MIKAFVIAFNRVTWLRNLCAQLQAAGCQPIIIDNNSDYPPLLEFYRTTEYKVHRMGSNWGHQILWKSGLINQYDDRHYIVTDPDLDLTGIPLDWPQHLMKGLWNNHSAMKAGLSLRIDDLPDNPYAQEAYNWEKKFWEGKRDVNGFVFADIDTTLAIYDRERNFGDLPNNYFFRAVRADLPYTARHLPWYLTKEKIEANEEERYYHDRTNTYWSQKLKELL